MISVRTPCRSGRLSYRAAVLSLVVSVVLMGLVFRSTWGLHGVLAEGVGPGRAESSGLELFARIVAANLGAVALVASGALTAGIGTLALAPVVGAHLAILLGTGHEWLTPTQWWGGLAVHGGGEALAITLACTAGLYPLTRTLTSPSDRQRHGTARLYGRAVAETLPLLGAATAVVLLAATWETLVSTRLV